MGGWGGVCPDRLCVAVTAHKGELGALAGFRSWSLSESNIRACRSHRGGLWMLGPRWEKFEESFAKLFFFFYSQSDREILQGFFFFSPHNSSTLFVKSPQILPWPVVVLVGGNFAPLCFLSFHKVHFLSRC